MQDLLIQKYQGKQNEKNPRHIYREWLQEVYDNAYFYSLFTKILFILMPERYITYKVRTKTVELLEVVVELLQAVAVLVGIVVDYH